jgi:hypothetical protein
MKTFKTFGKRTRRKGTLIFEPLPFVRRVIFMATPYRGSYWALGLFGDLASGSVNPLAIDAVNDCVRHVASSKLDCRTPHPAFPPR